MTNKPKPLLAVELRENGASYDVISLVLGVKRDLVAQYVSRGRHYENHLRQRRDYWLKKRGKTRQQIERERAALDKRNAAIVKSYNRIGQAETARKFGISRNIVAGVVHRARAAS